MVLLVERENEGFSMSSSPRCTEIVSSSCSAAFLAAIAAMYSEVCSDPCVGFRYLKRSQWMDKGDKHVNTNNNNTNNTKNVNI
jgi:hypothetical protein